MLSLCLSRFKSCCLVALKQAVILLLLSCSLRADLSIDRVKVDGVQKPVAGDLKALPSSPAVFRVSSKSELVFEFSQKQATGQSTARLRYKMEGLDERWRDLRPRTPMRLILQFFNASKRGVGITPFEIEGETPGWRGKVEWSDFHDFKEQTFVPETAAFVRVQVTSAGSDAGIGVIGIDALHLRIEAPTGGPVHDYDFTVREASDVGPTNSAKAGPGNGSVAPVDPLNWHREGSWLPMAKLGVRPDPSPHTILVLDDDRSTHNAAWGFGQGELIPVRSGERISVHWQSAHSIGSGAAGQAKYSALPVGNYRFSDRFIN